MSKKLSRIMKTSLVYCGVVSALSSVQVMAEENTSKVEEQQIERIMVTARKKEESIIEVPMAISSISAMEIQDRNYLNAEDLYRTLAGAAAPRGELILRGLSGGNNDAPGTTATFTDGVPFEFTNLSDIERVEVLRGPQGTLYGSNAIGGTVRVITKKPVMNEFELFGSMQGKTEKSVAGYDSNMSLGINLPLVDDTLALRVNGNLFNNKRPMVNAYTGNQSQAEGNFIRAQLLWQPADEMRFNFGYVREEYDSQGTTVGDRSKPGGYYEAVLTPDADALYGYDVDVNSVECDANLERPACLLGGENILGQGVKDKYTVYDIIDGSYNEQTDLFTLAFDHDNLFDFASMSYVGSYREYEEGGLDNWSRLDASDMFRTWIINDDFEERTTHELRFQNLSTDSAFSWTVGMFYDKTTQPKNPNVQWQYHESGDQVSALANYWWGVDATATGIEKFNDANRNWNSARVIAWEKELSFFADASYTIDAGDMGEIELNAGIRRYDLEDYSHTTSAGIWSEDNVITSGKENGNRLKFSASYRPTENFSTYLLYSEGYRPGGNNGPLAQSCVADPKAGDKKDRYTSDKIDNYEVGFKGLAFDGNFSFAAAAYQIDWTDIKTDIYMDTCGFTFTANGGEAVSRGLEFESTAQLTKDISMVFNASYTKSELTEDNDAISGKKGDDMTMVPDYNAYLAFDKAIEVYGKQAYIRMDMTAYGAYKTHFKTLATDEVDAYQVFNLSGRIEVSDSVQLSLHINNLFDSEDVKYKRARSRSATSTAQQYIEYLPERNLTVRLDYTFF